MNKFIVLVFCVICCLSTYSAKVNRDGYKYIRYGGNLELIVLNKTASSLKIYNESVYGIRKNGEIILPPEYLPHEVCFPADLFLLVFMKHSDKSIYAYSVETGEEVINYHYADNLSEEEIFSGFELVTDAASQQRKYYLVAKIAINGTVKSRVIYILSRKWHTTHITQP